MKQKILFSMLTVGIIGALIAITLFYFPHALQENRGQAVVQDIAQLADIFDRINKTAGILNFDHQKNRIDFLNIKKDGFVGSELGSMNMAHPDKWDGPYVSQVQTFKEEDYMIVRTKKGYFITPADDIKLPNGMVIGKDLMLDENADIESLMHEGKPLFYQGKPLAAKISVGAVTPFQQIMMPEDEE